MGAARIKSGIRRLLTLPGVTVPFRQLTRDCGTIIFVHRFRDPELGNRGHDPEGIRAVLAGLRKRRYELLPLTEMVSRLLEEGPLLRRSVAFTMDDGYVDQATIGSNIFAEFDCPVTLFATTGFLDRELWMWWDKIEHIFRETERSQLAVKVDGIEVMYSLRDDDERTRSQRDLTERCKRLPDLKKTELICETALRADVEIPQASPPRYRPMTWTQLRQCERRGMAVGPHTVRHPVLSQVSSAESRREIETSWARVREEATRAVPIFAYPNGQWRDFGDREILTLRDVGLMCAVTTEEGYNTLTGLRSDPLARYRLRRFGCPDSLAHVLQFVSGVERVLAPLKSR